MAKICKSFSELEEYVKENLTDVLTTEVYDVVMDQVFESSEKVIYEAYVPWTYTEDSPYPRRHTWSKEESYQVSCDDGLTLEIYPEAEYNHVLDTDPNFGNEAEGIYYGLANKAILSWRGHPNWEYKYPRPWIDDAKEQLASDNRIKKAFVKGLKTRGIKAV